ncbi:cytochrome c oxidase assembly factor 8 [Neocloeon triangulifer]|uniref:cytochrome c oxidase assembly factor 8 n=1 Tax=Neocloeon triangulifer TaxID=2078957 RepID=UPI00286F0A84|nr:cytochrome c oxidase assembly factor 8 [Neocloeon triangulifer]
MMLSITRLRSCVTLQHSSRLLTTSQNSPNQNENESGFVIQPVGEKDMVGPPDKVSNIRPVIFHVPVNESVAEKEYRQKRQEVLQWNQEFWTKHNLRFIKEREEFVKIQQQRKGNNETLCADEMSIFYKRFLDENWQVHVKYNGDWYKKNIGLMLQSFKIQILKSLGRLNGKS